jgi:hypothetical protein
MATPAPATCSAECRNGQHVFPARTSCAPTVLPRIHLTSARPASCGRDGEEQARPLHPPPLPHSPLRAPHLALPAPEHGATMDGANRAPLPTFLASTPPRHQPCAALSSPCHAASHAPLRRLPRSPEHPAIGNATGLAASVRGWATLSHHGHSRKPQHLRLVVFHPARALVAGQRRRRATAEPPAPVAGRPQAISRRSVTTHECALTS